jgi:fatty acid desaturase
VPVVYWVTIACGIPFWFYVVAMVIPGNAILLVRSYAEHRAHAATSERTAIVENSWVLGPLFLFNNLHALHHAEPGLPWYRYNARYRVLRERLVADNAGLVYQTYFDVARRYLFHLHDQAPHPLGRAPGSLVRDVDGPAVRVGTADQAGYG